MTCMETCHSSKQDHPSFLPSLLIAQGDVVGEGMKGKGALEVKSKNKKESKSEKSVILSV